MLLGGMRPHRVRRTRTVLDECLHIATTDGISRPIGKCLSVLRISNVLSEFVQVVRQTAGADDHDAKLAQWRQSLAEAQRPGRAKVASEACNTGTSAPGRK